MRSPCTRQPLALLRNGCAVLPVAGDSLIVMWRGVLPMITNWFSMTQPEPMLQHEIRLRAYDLYERRGGAGEHALDDWLRAEAEVLREKCATNFSRTNEPTR